MGAVPALPVFLACINRGEFCKALSTSSEVKCGRGATKQNKKQHQNVKKIANYLFKPYFPLTGLPECDSINSLQFGGRCVGYGANQGIHLSNIIIYCYECTKFLAGYWQCACGGDCTALVLQCLVVFFSKNHAHFNFFKLRHIFLKLRWKSSIQVIPSPFFPIEILAMHYN